MSKSYGEESSLIPAGGRSQGPPNDQMTPLFFITSRSSHRDLSSTFRKQPALPSHLISHPAGHTSELRHEHHLRKRWRRNNDRRNVSGDIPTLPPPPRKKQKTKTPMKARGRKTSDCNARRGRGRAEKPGRVQLHEPCFHICNRLVIGGRNSSQCVHLPAVLH